MISTSNFRKGMKLALDGELYIIVDFLNQKIGRGGAKMWTKLKNMKTGQVLERTFRGGETFDPPDFKEVPMQYLYNDDEMFHFMDSNTYEQTMLTADQVGDYIPNGYGLGERAHPSGSGHYRQPFNQIP